MLTIISHQDCLLHEISPGHPECAARVDSINANLKQAKLSYQSIDATPAPKENLHLAHSKEYIQQIHQHAPKHGQYWLDADTGMNAHTLHAALLAAGSVTQAVDLTMRAVNMQVFCNVRPPGHHAEANSGMGFCFFNNIAIAAKYALKQYKLSRIAIVDFDVHHGNGTQDIVQNDERILFCSSYQHPFYPNRFTNETANSIHIKMPAGTNSKQFRELVKNLWLDRLHKFNPEILFFSAGFDAHKNDPLGAINLTTDDYFWLTKEIIQATSHSTKNKVISALEGGYNLDVLAESAIAHVSAF